MFRDGEAQRYVGREGAHVRTHRVQPSSTPLCQRLNVIMTRWPGLIQSPAITIGPSFITCEGPAQSGTRSIKVAPKSPLSGPGPLQRNPCDL